VKSAVLHGPPLIASQPRLERPNLLILTLRSACHFALGDESRSNQGLLAVGSKNYLPEAISSNGTSDGMLL
jgi:hypothetical protein